MIDPQDLEKMKQARRALSRAGRAMFVDPARALALSTLAAGILRQVLGKPSPDHCGACGRFGRED